MKPPTRKRGEKDGGAASRAARQLREQRVDKIVGLMSHGKWNGAASHRDLGAQWGVSMHAVAEYAREASGIVRRVVEGNAGDIRAEIFAGLERIRVVAMKLVKPMRVGPDIYEDRVVPDLPSAIRAYELRAKMLGLMIDRVEVSQEIAGLSREETIVRLRAALERLESEK